MKKYSSILIILITFLSQGFADYAGNEKRETPPITPEWAFHPWIWEDSVNTQNSALGLINLYKEHKIPVGAIIIDSPWSTGYNNFEWDKEKYPDAQSMVDEMHKQGVYVIVWLTALINSESKDVPVQKIETYNYAKDHNYVVNNGKEIAWWKGKGMHVDFTNPDAVEWFNSQLDKLLELGIDGFKIDNGHAKLNKYRVNTYLGMMRNERFGSYYYSEIANHGLERNPNFVSIARGYSYQGSTSSQIEHLQVTWQGDFSGSWEGLRRQIDNTYKTARLGYGVVSVEVGGFMDEKSTKYEFVRYAQFGALCPVMINGGANGAFSNHLPWWHGNDVADIYRTYATLHTELIPYLFSESVSSHIHGGSIVKNTSINNQSHQLGECLFAKAITDESSIVNIHLPQKGNWIDYWTGKSYKGNTYLENQKYELDEFPIFIKEGCFIPMSISNNLTGFGDENFIGKQTILVIPSGKNKMTYYKPKGKGVEYSVVKIENDEVNRTLSIDADDEDDYIFLINTTKIKNFQNKGSKVINHSSGQYLKIEKYGKSFEINY